MWTHSNPCLRSITQTHLLLSAEFWPKVVRWIQGMGQHKTTRHIEWLFYLGGL